MRIPIRRYIYRCILCIPVVWFVLVLLYINSNHSLNKSSKILKSKDDSLIKPIKHNPNPHRFIHRLRNHSRQIMNNITAIEPIRDVRDNREQVVAPNVDDKRLDADRPGEMGNPFEIDKNRLTPGERKKYEDGFKNHEFNEYVSDLISTHRSLPDVRHSDCRKLEYEAPPITASIIMCFHNEAWSVLLRSIHSIIDRSPSHLLKEIILVDDFSNMEHLKKPLDDYIANLKIVSIIRQTKREGLIRSRLTGAAVVKGDVIIFLDSHIEVTEGWLLSLLDPISQNRTTVTTPIIDTIDDMTFKYSFGTIDDIGIGGFNWNLQFTWHTLPERDIKQRKHALEPVRSPTMAGGIFAISKSYFEELGTYDSGMDIWGGENLEMSFRIWMCGGTLVTVPCSHVGHVFRKLSPYMRSPTVDVLKKNNIRVAEVWLDDYKKFFYERFNYDLGDYGNVTSRKLLREKLQCKSFKWYLTEIYPEMFLPDQAVASGEIRNIATNFCVDGSTDRRSYQKPVIGYPCHNQGGNQFFMLSVKGEIRRDDGCLDYGGGEIDATKKDKVIVLPCHGRKENQQWIYDKDNQLYHSASELCLAVSKSNKHIRMQRCDIDNTRNIWSWKRKSNNETNKV